MKRPIEFRMWNPYTNNYLYDVENVYLCLAQQLVFDKVQPTRGYTLGYDHVSDGIIWEQFTGLTDKNGKKVFEGDILKSEQSDHLYIVEFNHGAFYCYHNELKNWDGMRLKWGGIWRFTELGMDVEVVGNIHDKTE